MADEIKQEQLDATSSLSADDQIAQLLAGDSTDNEENKNGVQDEGQETTEEVDGTEGEGEDEGDESSLGEDPQDVTWASALGVDDSQLAVDDEGNLKGLIVKVDGQVSTVPVKDLIAGYQMNKSVTQKSQALAQEKKEFEEVRTVAAKQLYTKLQQADKLADLMSEQLVGQFNSIDWETLRRENPGEYAAAVTDFNARKQKIDAIKAAIAEEGGETVNAFNQEQQAKFQQFLQEQYQQVIANNPEWQDPEKMKADIVSMGEFAESTYGITRQEFEMLSDARHVEILKDAMAYRKGKQVLQQKKQQKIPTFQKSSGKPSKPMSKATRAMLDARKMKPGLDRNEMQKQAIAHLILGD